MLEYKRIDIIYTDINKKNGKKRRFYLPQLKNKIIFALNIAR
jgi:hypothetical protein